jgi:hypothetical protein
MMEILLGLNVYERGGKKVVITKDARHGVWDIVLLDKQWGD